MSRFKAGDRVRCIKASHDAKVGELHIVACPDIDGTMMIENCAWWHSQNDFELVSPQPAESPDDWVTQDVVVRRTGVDESRWISELNGTTTPWELVTRTYISDQRHGSIITPWRLEVRCRRRDYPQQPVEVHSGGPYVARSEYERVLAESAAKDKAIAELAEHIRQLDRMIHEPTPNGWPLVPVDPSCIPEGHRAVEVTRNTAGKLVASSDGNARHFYGTHIVPRLVVEPIPKPQAPGTLPRPESPAWIRAGWWVAMDPGPVFWAYEDEPIVDEQCGEHTSIGKSVLLCDDQITPSMRAIPADRWREAKWQVE